ncbi:hypothetical protein Q8A73_014000 [Channa argus]|nr:hypothetical protein Q8A73_014000 [Channa argus]
MCGAAAREITKTFNFKKRALKASLQRHRRLFVWQQDQDSAGLFRAALSPPCREAEKAHFRLDGRPLPPCDLTPALYVYLLCAPSLVPLGLGFLCGFICAVPIANPAAGHH